MATEQVVVFPPTSEGNITIQKGEGSSILAGFIPNGGVPADADLSKIVVVLPKTLAGYQLDSNDRIIALTNTDGDPTMHSPFHPLNDFNPSYATAVRKCSLLASDSSLCDVAGKFRWAGHQADGVNFVPSFFESSASSLNNPGSVARTPIAAGVTGGGGITGILERVADTTNTSSVTDASKKFAWKLTCAATHYNTEAHARNQFTSPKLTPRKRYVHKLSIRFDSFPTLDSSQDCILWQLHQYESGQAWETNQLSAGIPAFTLSRINGRMLFTVQRPKDNMGSIMTNGLGNPYKAYGSEDNVQCEETYIRADDTRYTDITIEFFLDERELSEGGKGYLRVRSGGTLIMDYVGPTLQPLRAIDKNPRIVDCAVLFGLYFYNTPYDVSGATVANSIINSTQKLKPFRTVSLLVRESTLLWD